MKPKKNRDKKSGQTLLSLVDKPETDNNQSAHIIGDHYARIQTQTPDQNSSQTESDFKKPVSDQAVSVAGSLWLCIYFPQLSLDIATAGESSGSYNVVYQEIKGQCVVYRVSPAAGNKGVSNGMSLDAARILCPELQAIKHDTVSEQKKIQRLAKWAYQFSSELSVINNDALVLEVASSLKLFKGLETICKLVGQSLACEWNLTYSIAVTPTPLASLMLAHHRENDEVKIVEHKQALRSVLGKLPVTELLCHTNIVSYPRNKKLKSAGFTDKDIKSLNSMGVKILADLWRLPPKELLSRFGIEAMRYLDRLLGERIEQHLLYQPPLTCSVDMELPLEVKTNKLVLQALSKLLDEFISYLCLKDAATDEIKIILGHSSNKHTKASTELKIKFRQISRDKKHIFNLIEERFNRVVLEAPVLKVALIAGYIETYNADSRELFEYDANNKASDHCAWKGLVEQLHARLGKNKIKYITSFEDHRPERAWRFRKPKAKTVISGSSLLRPTWLLPEAVRIHVAQSQLELLHGPERIENGWWDGGDIRRDYYIARDKLGVRLWVYCDLKYRGQWYVHGLFA